MCHSFFPQSSVNSVYTSKKLMFLSCGVFFFSFFWFVFFTEDSFLSESFPLQNDGNGNSTERNDDKVNDRFIFRKRFLL